MGEDESMIAIAAHSEYDARYAFVVVDIVDAGNVAFLVYCTLKLLKPNKL